MQNNPRFVGTYKRRSAHHRTKKQIIESAGAFHAGPSKQGGFFVTFIHSIDGNGGADTTRVFVNADSRISAMFKAEKFIDREYIDLTAAPAGVIPDSIAEGIQTQVKRQRRCPGEDE